MGHRGAAGLAPENTLSSIKVAIKAGVDAVEFDVRPSADGVLILSHDEDFMRRCGVDKKVSKLSLKSINKLRTYEKEPIPTLDEALVIAKDVPVIIEAKNGGWARLLARELNVQPRNKKLSVISFNHYELYAFSKLCQNVKIYALNQHSGLEAITAARIYGFNGIDINYWTLNPLVYYLAQRHNLEIVVYTVDKPWVASFLRLLYPKIAITTNLPNKMQFLRPKLLRNKSL